jgi:hypothetical protein
MKRIQVLQSSPPVPHQGNGCPMVWPGWAKDCDIFDPRDTSPPLNRAQLCTLLESAFQDGLIRVRVCGETNGKLCHYHFQTTSKFDGLCEVLTASPNHLHGQSSTDTSSFDVMSVTDRKPSMPGHSQSYNDVLDKGGRGSVTCTAGDAAISLGRDKGCNPSAGKKLGKTTATA